MTHTLTAAVPVVRYAIELGHYDLVVKPVHPHGQSVTGYGAKISTNRMLRFNGCTRLYRVYATCFGNCASQWVLVGGDKFHI